MKTIPLVILGCLLSAVCADPASDLKKLLEQGVTSGPEFEKAVAAVRGGGANPAAPATNAPPMAYDRLDVGGKVYEQVTVRKVEPDGLSIMHAAGTKKLYFRDLPEEMRNAYGYDPAAAARHQEAVRSAEAQAAAAERLAQADAQVEKSKRNLDDAVERTAVDAWVKVMQNGGGPYVLCHWGSMIQVPEISHSGLSPKVTGYHAGKGAQQESIIAVYGLGHLADGERWTGSLYPCGNQTYTAVNGGGKTVKRFATTVEKASELMLK